MSIFSSVKATINRYGESVKVIENEKAVKTKAFIQPLRYQNKSYSFFVKDAIGLKSTNKYLYIGMPDVVLKQDKCIIESPDKRFIVRRCETFFVKDFAVYQWAILVPYQKPLEDDYESN